MGKRFKRVIRQATAEEGARYAEVRRNIEQEFPPLDPARGASVKNRVAAAMRSCRTWKQSPKHCG